MGGVAKGAKKGMRPIQRAAGALPGGKAVGRMDFLGHALGVNRGAKKPVPKPAPRAAAGGPAAPARKPAAKPRVGFGQRMGLGPFRQGAGTVGGVGQGAPMLPGTVSRKPPYLE